MNLCGVDKDYVLESLYQNNPGLKSLSIGFHYPIDEDVTRRWIEALQTNQPVESVDICLHRISLVNIVSLAIALKRNSNIRHVLVGGMDHDGQDKILFFFRTLRDLKVESIQSLQILCQNVNLKSAYDINKFITGNRGLRNLTLGVIPCISAFDAILDGIAYSHVTDLTLLGMQTSQRASCLGSLLACYRNLGGLTISVSGPETLPILTKAMPALTNLLRFEITFNFDQDVHTILLFMLELTQLQSLQHLTLRFDPELFSALSISPMQTIVSCLSRLHNLDTLVLDFPSILPGALVWLGHAFAGLRHIKLWLSHKDDLAVAAAVAHCTDRLETLDLEDCELSNSDVVELARVLANKPNLKRLNVADNCIDTVGATALLHLARHHPNLQSIQLDEMDVNAQVYCAILFVCSLKAYQVPDILRNATSGLWPLIFHKLNCSGSIMMQYYLIQQLPHLVS